MYIFIAVFHFSDVAFAGRGDRDVTIEKSSDITQDINWEEQLALYPSIHWVSLVIVHNSQFTNTICLCILTSLYSYVFTIRYFMSLAGVAPSCTFLVTNRIGYLFYAFMTF